MPRTSVDNATENILCLWLEPWGTDHWMRPGERFTVVADAPDEEPFSVVIHDQGISVWVNVANAAEVLDENGNDAPCGHQRPIEAIRDFLAGAERMLERVDSMLPNDQDMTRTYYERLRQELAQAEANQRHPPEPTTSATS